ncbi:MAG TPA: hypothetical protein ENN19_18620 [Chloroflexi bacterium]|nr:hypothetical protein [Chloroflexota bacterium]
MSSVSTRWRRWLCNPLIQRELARSWHKYSGVRRVLLMIWMALLGAVVGCGVVVVLSGSPVDLSGGEFNFQPRGTHLAALGTGLPVFCLLGAVSSILSGVLPWIVPVFTATSIVREREQGTLDVLRVTLLTEGAIAWGKLAQPFLRLWPAILVILFLSPLQVIWASGAGLMWGQPMTMFGIIGVTANPGAIAPWLGMLALFFIGFFKPWADLILYATIGLFISTWARSTAFAVALTYGAILVTRFSFGLLTTFLSALFPFLFFDPMMVSMTEATSMNMFWLSALGAALVVFLSGVGAAVLFGGTVWRLRRL